MPASMSLPLCSPPSAAPTPRTAASAAWSNGGSRLPSSSNPLRTYLPNQTTHRHTSGHTHGTYTEHTRQMHLKTDGVLLQATDSSIKPMNLECSQLVAHCRFATPSLTHSADENISPSAEPVASAAIVATAIANRRST